MEELKGSIFSYIGAYIATECENIRNITKNPFMEKIKAAPHS
jgi:hypothetical protein